MVTSALAGAVAPDSADRAGLEDEGEQADDDEV
jgi:hypothetical protein